MADDWAPTTVRWSDITGTVFADVTPDGGKVDTELPTAAAISADGEASPTAPAVYSFLMGFNGTSWDRLALIGDAINGLDVDVTRLPFETVIDGAAAGTNGIHVLGTDGTNAQILATTSAGFLKVDDGGGSITVDGAFPTIVTDGAAAGATGIHVLGTDGTNAQILSTQTSGALNIHDGGNSITVDGAFPPMITDGATVGTVGIHVLGTDGTNAQILATTSTGAVKIDDNGASITVDGAVTVSGTATVSGTVTANAGTGVFDVTPASPAAGDYLPVRLTDGSGFYSSASSSGITAAKVDTINSGDLAPAASATVNGTQIASGKTGKLMQATFAASIPGKYELKTLLNASATLRAVFFADAGETVVFTPPTKDFITQVESATAGADAFAVTFTSQEPAGGSTATMYATLLWDETT